MSNPDQSSQTGYLVSADNSSLRFNKPVEMVHSVAERSLTPVQARISNLLLRHVLLHEPDESGWYTIGMSELRHLLNFGSRNYTPLLTAAHALQGIKYEWDVLVNAQNQQAVKEGRPGPKNRTLQRTSVLFPEIEVKVSAMRFQVSRPVVDLVLKPDMYAALDLEVINRLRRTASIVLYEQIQRYVKLGATRRAPWETYRNMIMGSDSAFNPLIDYRRFKARVLTPAIAEIESQHPFFRITLNEHREKGSSRIADIAFGISVDPSYRLRSNQSDPNVIRQIAAMVGLGITQATAKSIMDGERSEDIDAAIRFVADRISETSNSGSPIRSPAAFLRRCMKEKWWMGTPIEQKTAELAQPITDAPPKPPAVVNDLDPLKEQYNLHQRQNAQNDLLELPDGERQLLFARYNDQQVLKRLQVTDASKLSKMAESAFLCWYIKTHYAEPSDQDLLKFAAKLIAKAA